MIGITSVNGFHLPFEERFSRIKQAGFGSVMLWFGGEDGIPRLRKAEIVRDIGLYIENVHSSSDGINDLWLDGDGGEHKLDDLSSQLEDCAVCGVGTMIVHLSKGKNPPPVSSIGFGRIGKLIERAEAAKVRLAFENMRFSEYTVKTLDMFSSPYVGLCWDAGHENCWTGDVDWLKRYSSRVFAIHLHDNNGDGDSHMLPFDGTVFWDMKLTDIAASSYSGNVTVESEFESSGLYDKDGFDAYLTKAYERGLMIEHMLDIKRSEIHK
nr:sugar phosphate isomerase/epimerase [Clostridia bacterium]